MKNYAVGAPKALVCKHKDVSAMRWLSKKSRNMPS